MDKGVNQYRFNGEWTGEWTTRHEAQTELDRLNEHPVLGNQMWWMEEMDENGLARVVSFSLKWDVINDGTSLPVIEARLKDGGVSR